jgi:hypothetical protein
MSVKAKAPKGRKPTFTDDVLDLFRKLDAVPKRQRLTSEFRAQDKELHRALGLWGDRICNARGVLDRDPPRATGFVHSPLTSKGNAGFTLCAWRCSKRSKKKPRQWGPARHSSRGASTAIRKCQLVE